MKVTPEHVNALIEHAQYHRFKNTTTTVCCITLKNGHTTVGYSACADPAEFNEQLGMKIAFNKARDEIYNLEAYKLSDVLNRERKVTDAEQVLNERSTTVGESVKPFLDFLEKSRATESTEEAEQDEQEYRCQCEVCKIERGESAEPAELPAMNIEVEFIEEERDNRVISISDEERDALEFVLYVCGEITLIYEGERWKMVGLCDEGAICEYVGEVSE